MNLVRRLVKGARLTAQDHDQNIDEFEAAINSKVSQEDFTDSFNGLTELVGSKVSQEDYDAKITEIEDDPRWTDDREWSASTISQAEAEDGVATTRRAWTSQRVRQAILSWWNGSASKTKLDGIESGAQVNAVTSVASKTGAVTLAKGDVGLANVDNTSDANKPISDDTQDALDLRVLLSVYEAKILEIEGRLDDLETP